VGIGGWSHGGESKNPTYQPGKNLFRKMGKKLFPLEYLQKKQTRRGNETREKRGGKKKQPKAANRWPEGMEVREQRKRKEPQVYTLNG